jgi:putative phage-type endonuclease
MNAPIVTHPDRSKFLGGSDAAAVMGLSPWATPVELWQQKTGRVEREAPDAARQKIFDRGHKLEPFIIDMVIDKLRERGHEVELLATNQRYVDPEHAFLSCEIDFEILLDGEHINGDAKSVSGFARKKWGEEDTEDVPIEYAAQFMHGLMITGRSRCLVAALRSFDEVEIYWVNRDEETIAGMRPMLVSFWVDHVLADAPPDPMTFGDIKALFPLDNGQSIEATDDIREKVSRLADVKRQIKALEDIEESLTFEVGEFISPNSVLTFAGQELATWKGQKDSRIDQTLLKAELPEIVAQYTKTKTIRVLRLKKGKQS